MNLLDNIKLSTAEVCNGKMEHKGHGLLLVLETESLILTCHHVIAEMNTTDLFIRLQENNGKISELIPATYDHIRSNPSNDIVVLQIENGRQIQLPLLQSINSTNYLGRLPVTGFTFMVPENFDAILSAAVSLDLDVQVRGEYAPIPDRYKIPIAFRLAETTDSRPGISGAPVVCEKGILGLTHFARSEAANTSREAYLVPISAWLKNWNDLAKYIKPFVDHNMLQAATVKTVKDIDIGLDFLIERFNRHIFQERPVFEIARMSLQKKGIIIVGKPKSGKTRLAFELLSEYPDSIIVIPFHDNPPENFESAGIAGKNLILFFDDLHLVADSMKVMQWYQQLNQSGVAECKIICTSRAGDDWNKKVKERQRQLIRELGENSIVSLSTVDNLGEDMSFEEGMQLARLLNIDETDFAERFDGTPGSLTLDLKDMAENYKRLRDEEHDGISAAIFLDACKLLNVCNQPRLMIDLILDISTHFAGGKVLSPALQNKLLRRVEEEGFGHFDRNSEELKIYRPYLEECVDFEPTLKDIEALLHLLDSKKDLKGLSELARALEQYNYDTLAEKAARIATNGGELSSLETLANILKNKPGNEIEAEELYRAAIKNGYEFSSWFNLGAMLSAIPGREGDAEIALRRATETKLAFVAYLVLGDLLSSIPGREKDAEEAYNRAIELEGFKSLAYRGLGFLLATMQGRETDAESAFRSAIEAMKEYGDPENYLPGIYLRLAQLLQDTADRQGEAEEYFKIAMDAGEPDAKLHYYLYLLLQEGREAEFRNLVNELLQNNDPLGNYFHGYILLDEGSRDEALAAFHLAKERGVEFAERTIKLLEEETNDKQ